ncbi:GMC oxidoreductase [Amaricoccus sp.]|uniref:GMC oxidoreductase n=1 Tax=Amaricoccus sp. TaxID=1872485 RepID=UPI001B7BE9BA|nr:GMC oxidoreductase [Amaricoccus sp.]MBP7242285.1 GMC family oxidoreductase [Amaricoccus sp.]
MRVDADGPGRGAFARSFDVCVIGAGPAGITLARRLAALGHDVALMEGGGEDITAESQEIYEGEPIGRDYWPLDVPRLRFLGGSSGHWGGWCRQLDDVDFAAKSWNPMSGWPIDKAALDPYAREADGILDIPRAETDQTDAEAAAGFRQVFFRFSLPPTNFRDKYSPELDASPRITLGLNANLVDLDLSPDGAEVVAARFRGWDPADEGFAVKARAYVLACGGIENPRLLLNFDRQAPGGIGNANDLVGRYFAEHPHFVLAEAIFRAPFDLPKLSFYSPTEAFMAENEILNFGMRIERMDEPFFRQFGTIAGDPACTDPFMLRLAERIADVSPGCAPGGDGRVSFDGLLRFAHEQALNPDSRVLLAPDSDRFGLRRGALDWRLGELDKRTQHVALLAFGKMLADEDIGRIRIRDWVLREPFDWPGIADDEVGGKHHMGTTRMADDPKRGVVDRDCKVYGLANLWIAGSSVFPTGGHANPTYTIIQLTLRLGDHLDATLG